MIIDGKQISQNLLNKIKDEVVNLVKKPGLAVILTGDDPASKVYVNVKEKACIEVGFYSRKIKLSKDTTEQELLNQILALNIDDKIDGILVQLPLPKQIDSNLITEAINPNKDVDGFHSENIGKLMQNRPFLRPCTPKGIMTMLKSIEIDLVGKNCVIVGSSNIVGRPMAMELLNAGSTITICNSKTQNLLEKTLMADILIVGVGSPKMIKSEWVKEGSVVIDVGINRLNNGKLVGDVDFVNVSKKASFITPVPGGVGPMTIATLLENTLMAYKKRKL